MSSGYVYVHSVSIVCKQHEFSMLSSAFFSIFILIINVMNMNMDWTSGKFDDLSGNRIKLADYNSSATFHTYSGHSMIGPRIQTQPSSGSGDCVGIREGF